MLLKSRRMLRISALLLVGMFLSPLYGIEVSLNQQTFTIPNGFELELVAGPPFVDRPVSADLDSAGNLYVTEASGTNANVQQQLEDKPHRVLRLSDTDGDGVYDIKTVLAEQMMLPEGSLWYGDSLFVAAPPSIWQLTDADRDGVAEGRAEWFKGKTLTGCANDLHGPYLGRDGWIYWCKGAFAEQSYQRPNGAPFVTRAAHIFRRHPSGQGSVEPVMTGGMDNPVEVVFSLSGERFFTTTFLQHPGGGRRDGILHAVYGGVYGKDHNVLEGHIRTGQLMPVMTHLGAAAPSGLALLESRELGFRDQLVATQFNLRKVSRHALRESGASYTTSDHDLVVSDSLDFHPTDVLEDADGSLLIIDTGGWYKLCCPTSQLEKADVLGGIYRLRRKGSHLVDDPYGMRLQGNDLSAERLVALLGDRRPFVRRWARRELAQAATPDYRLFAETLKDETDDRTAAEVVWAVSHLASSTKVGHDQAERILTNCALDHQSPMVQQAALNAISVNFHSASTMKCIDRILHSERTPHVLRTAAEVVSRQRGNLEPLVPVRTKERLLQLAANTGDRFLEHACAFALCTLPSEPMMADALKSDNVDVRLMATLITTQASSESKVLPSGDYLWNLLLQVEGDVALQKLLWIVDETPELRRQMVASGNAWAERSSSIEVGELFRRISNSSLGRGIAADWLRLVDLGDRPPLLTAIANARASLGDGLVDDLVALLKDSQTSLRQAQLILKAFRHRPMAPSKAPSTATYVAKWAKSATAQDIGWRALASVPPKQIEADAELFAGIVSGLVSNNLQERATAVEAISRLMLTHEQGVVLSRLCGQLGRIELPVVLTALNRVATDEVGRQIVQSLASSAALGGIADSELRERMNRFSSKIQDMIIDLAVEKRPGLQEQIKRIERIVPLVANADARRGQALFHNAKAACTACHELGYVGGNVGPDLSRIGGTRSARDLIESILVPSASFVRSYEPWLIETNDGRAHAGIVRDQSVDSIVVITADQKEVQILRDNIESMQPSDVSVMPAGLGGQVSDQDLADLVRFLLDAR